MKLPNQYRVKSTKGEYWLQTCIDNEHENAW